MKNIKIILNEDVYNLGEEGDVREVAPGYARNYLIPKGLAVPYTREYVAQFADRRAAIERRKEEKRTAAQGVKERIENLTLTFQVPAGDSGKLFGSITNATISDRLMQDGLQIERKKIEVPGHTVKMTGDYQVIIKLYADESATLNITVEPEGGSKKSAAKSEKPQTPKAVEVADTDDTVEDEEPADEEVAAEVDSEVDSEESDDDDYSEEESE